MGGTYKHSKDADEVAVSVFDSWNRSCFHRMLATLIDHQVAGPDNSGLSEETKMLMSNLYGIDLGVWGCPF